MGLFSKMFGGTKDPSKSQSSNSHSQPAPSKNPAQPSSQQPTRPQDPSKNPNQPAAPVRTETPQTPARPSQPVKEQPKIRTWKYVIKAIYMEDAESRTKFLDRIAYKANYENNFNHEHVPHNDPHHLYALVGMDTDKSRIHIEVKGTDKDVESFIDWVLRLREFKTHATAVHLKTEIFSSMSRSGLDSKHFDGPWSR